MSEQLFKLLADSAAGVQEKIKSLAAYAKEELKTPYLEIRLDGADPVSLGELPEDMWDLCRAPIGPHDRPVGEIAAAPDPTGDFPPDLSAFVRCAELIQRLQQGYIDNLTGLYNRRRLDMELAALAVSDEPVAVAMLDIDYFKRVNDTYGHEAGDEVLRVFAGRLAQEMPEGAFLARYGGEEFCLILRAPDEKSGSSAVESVRGGVCSAFIPFRKQEIRISSSAGVACGSGRHVQTLLGLADQALYAAKEGGRNQTVRSADISKPRTPRLFRRAFRRICSYPISDLGWFGNRVIGYDRRTARQVCVDYFGGVVAASSEMPGILSFARVGNRSYCAMENSPGIRIFEHRRNEDVALPISLPENPPCLRRVHLDARLGRLVLIDSPGQSAFWTDYDLSPLKDIRIPEPDSLRALTAALGLGEGLLVLDALARRIFIVDREKLTPKRTWRLPEEGYEICLCYLPDSKQIMAGGASGMRLFNLSGAVVDELSQPVISAYAHPAVGLVLSTPDETMIAR